MSSNQKFEIGQEVFFISNNIDAIVGGNIYKAKVHSFNGDILCYLKFDYVEEPFMSDTRILYSTLDEALHALIEFLKSYHNEIKND